MKKIGLIIILLMTLPVVSLYGQKNEIGIGLLVGAPTGFTGKMIFPSTEEAVQGFIGGGFGGVTIGADYLFHSDAFNHPDIPFYVGPGVFIGSSAAGGPKYDSNSLGLGVRGMFGVSYFFPKNPFEISFEIGPVLYIAPRVDVGIGGGLAFRFYPGWKKN